MSKAYDKETLEAFKAATSMIMAKFPETRHFEDTDVCGEMADMAMFMASYYVAHAALAHALDHPDVGPICAYNIIDSAGDDMQAATHVSFKALTLSLEQDYPGLIKLLERDKEEKDVNMQTYDEIMAMIKDGR